MTNAEILAQVRSEPASGGSALYSRYASRVRWIVRRMLGPDAEVDDLVQQVFHALIESGLSVRDPAKLGSWIHSFAVNTVRDELRRRRVRRNASESIDDEMILDFQRDIEARDLFARLWTLIDRLPATERLVFLLRSLQGHTFAEVAEQTGTSIATTKRRLARANRRFKALLDRHPDLLRHVSMSQVKTA